MRFKNAPEVTEATLEVVCPAGGTLPDGSTASEDTVVARFANTIFWGTGFEYFDTDDCAEIPVGYKIRVTMKAPATGTPWKAVVRLEIYRPQTV